LVNPFACDRRELQERERCRGPKAAPLDEQTLRAEEEAAGCPANPALRHISRVLLAASEGCTCSGSSDPTADIAAAMRLMARLADSRPHDVRSDN
jgi:hypothetical protein